MVKGRLFLLVTTVSAWATPSAVLEPREGTPCLSSCENPSNDSCKLCCGQFDEARPGDGCCDGSVPVGVWAASSIPRGIGM